MIGFLDTPLVSGAQATPPLRDDRWRPELEAALFPGAEVALAKLRSPGALVVTSGQQPGLFTGPLYSIHKALSARGVALALEARSGRPVVPVFWVAGDDHDYAEGAATWWLGADGAVVAAELEPRPADAPLTPLYREPVPPAIAGLLERRARPETRPSAGFAGTISRARASAMRADAPWPSSWRRSASPVSTRPIPPSSGSRFR